MYRAPIDEISFTLKHIAGLSEALDSGLFEGLTEDLVDAILAEAGRFAGDEIAPLAKIGDEIGAQLKDAVVTTPPGWKDLYTRWAQGGWNSLTAEQEFGGQGLPAMLSVATMEMWNSGAMSFALAPTLTMGAIDAIEKHASQALKEKYLPRLISGEWMGTMNLTEPQAGSDLSGLRTRAERAVDGSYRIFGQKIYITFGEHDFTDNIVHLVLARLSDAPAGTRGISLFLVPKFLVGDDGGIGARNDVFCAGIEHKLGIHAAPTCTMIFGDGFGGAEKGAVGWLVGEENRGLACMFTMMNSARLSTGMQGVGVAEAAYQKALAHALERRQGKAATYTGEGAAPIVRHPDVQRDLLTMKALTQVARAVTYSCAHAGDMARIASNDGTHWEHRVNLLTPVAKAFASDLGVEVASLGIQVHGGMGYVEETGAAALLRDIRIAPIYEGTNGIQAIDLVMRKLPQGDGEHVHGYIAELSAIAEQVRASNRDGFGDTASELAEAIEALAAATTHLQSLLADGRNDAALAGATPYLRLFGLTAGGAYLAKGALTDAGRTDLCRFFAENLLAETAALKKRVINGAASLSLAAATLVAG